MKKLSSARRWAWLAAVLITLAWSAAPDTLHAATPARRAQAGDGQQFLPLLRQGVAPLCRFGVNGALGSYPVRPLRLGWYMDYAATRTATPPQGADYFPMIRLEQVGDSYNYSIYINRAPTTDAELGAVIQAHPGAQWFIGNEPDRIQFQDDLEPHVYARAYHDLYHRIKEQDPVATVIAGSIVQPTPVRLRYLDMVLAAYHAEYQERMPVDAWAFHNFMLNEANCAYFFQLYPGQVDYVKSICWGADIPPGLQEVAEGLRLGVQDNDDIELFKNQVIAFRTWLAERGYRETPVYLSEYGVLMPMHDYPEFSYDRVNTFMNASFDFLLNATDPEIGYPADGNRLVQRFSWYSINDKYNHNGNLFDPALPAASSTTPFGANFAAYTNSLDDEVDLYPLRVGMVGAPPPADQGPATIVLKAAIANSGNLMTPQQANVRFYNGDPASGGTPIGDPVQVNLAGCGELQTAGVTWANVAPGNYTVYVVVDREGVVAETNEDNNTLSASLGFAAGRLQIPLVRTPLHLAE